jgi:hypothetical protein
VCGGRCAGVVDTTAVTWASIDITLCFPVISPPFDNVILHL